MGLVCCGSGTLCSSGEDAPEKGVGGEDGVPTDSDDQLCQREVHQDPVEGSPQLQAFHC